jgi:diguanylate cyclase (GGDEF)-like protein
MRRPPAVSKSVRLTRSWLNDNGWRAIGALLVIPTLMYLPLARARWTMIALAPLVAAFNLVVNRLVQNGRPRAAWLTLVGFTAIVSASMLVPRLWVPMMVLLTANVAYATRWLGRRYAVTATVLTTGLLAATAVLQHQPNALGAISLWAISAAVTVGIIGDARIEADNRAAQYANLVESVALGMVMVQNDKTGVLRVAAINPAMRHYTERNPHDLVGMPVADAFADLFDATTVRTLAAVAEGGEPVEVGPTRVQTQNIHYVRIKAFPLAGRTAAITMEDATAWHLATAALSYQTNHDALTGLPNRPHVLQRINKALAAATEAGTDVSLAIIDLDRFRQVNDAFGHHEGDRLLIELGRRLKTSVRADVVGRIGGDEFAVLITGVNAAARADAVAEKVLKRFDEPFEVHETSIQTSAAIGIATFPLDASDAPSLIQRAELAMYAAKTSNDRILHFAAEDHDTSPGRLALLADFRRAVCAGELTTEYQPIIDLATGGIVGAETLVRWQHPEHGLLLPGEFLELADQAGMVGPLTEAVAALAIADASRWHRLGHAVGITINLTQHALQDHSTVAQLLHLLDLAELPARLLRVELTEQALLQDPAAATRVLSELRTHGAEVAIDDFGTGYSSLSLLRQMPIDELKIDNTFITRLSPHDTGLVRSIIDLGHALGLRVVAEGIESPLVRDVLVGLGCDRGQGYYFGPAVDAESFLELLRNAAPIVARPGSPRSVGGATVTNLASRRALGTSG